MSADWRRNVVAFGWGSLFALGLGVSGLAKPDVILGFLDFTGAWDPTLLVALVVASTVYMGGFAVTRRRNAPVMAPRFDLPRARRIDGQLLAGAALFGAGWGAAGMCPGANLVLIGGLDPRALTFTAAMLTGMALFGKLRRRVDVRATSGQGPQTPPLSLTPLRTASRSPGPS